MKSVGAVAIAPLVDTRGPVTSPGVVEAARQLAPAGDAYARALAPRDPAHMLSESARAGELGAALEDPARGAFDLRDPAHFPPMPPAH